MNKTEWIEEIIACMLALLYMFLILCINVARVLLGLLTLLAAIMAFSGAVYYGFHVIMSIVGML